VGRHASDQGEGARKHRLERLASLADVQPLKGKKAKLHFDEDRAYLQCARFEFESTNDLVRYVADQIPTESHGRGIAGTLVRTGKYQRISRQGEQVFSFGDPLLDLVTNDEGTIVIGGREFDLRAAELGHLDRGGGLTTIDFSGQVQSLRKAHLKAAVTQSERFALVECTDESLIVASRNPHEQWFYQGTTKMRFRAFDRSYFVYEKIGAEIETWGHDFRSASISSRYGRFLDEAHGHCFTLHTDSDSDTNDDYVDEYEWFLGGGVSSGYDGVRSSCVANWHDRTHSGVVALGCVVLEF
jgi:hypothetical protein